ncbi:hypothetical protein UFOVP138_39 [uncultured Caudovirales phage]|uniref:Uncharacterized protein n=1 Tax=uncultured Caudovirales phage TaxID=2100421 RepID=A0A6J5LG40_9CAUD|nr:hypothetical protein UFOVP138_39 [uncultured Caudovirales phage]
MKNFILHILAYFKKGAAMTDAIISADASVTPVETPSTLRAVLSAAIADAEKAAAESQDVLDAARAKLAKLKGDFTAMEAVLDKDFESVKSIIEAVKGYL